MLSQLGTVTVRIPLLQAFCFSSQLHCSNFPLQHPNHCFKEDFGPMSQYLNFTCADI